MKKYNALSMFKDLENVALIAHIEPDPDALSSMVVLKEFLQKFFNVKNVDIFAECSGLTSSLQEILGNNNLNPEIKNYHLAIMMDSPNTERLGIYKTIFENTARTIVIDHHATNLYEGDFNIVEICSSTCEIVYSIIKEFNYSLSTIQQGKLYAGIITDTDNFKVGAISNRTFQIISEFAENVDREAIYNAFLANNTHKSMQLLSIAINNISSYNDGQIIITSISQNEAKSVSANHNDMCAIVNQIATINTAKLVCFIEPRNDKYYASMRSKQGYDVSEIARRNGGGGHVGAAAFVSELSLEETKELILKEFETQLANVIPSKKILFK